VIDCSHKIFGIEQCFVKLIQYLYYCQLQLGSISSGANIMECTVFKGLPNVCLRRQLQLANTIALPRACRSDRTQAPAVKSSNLQKETPADNTQGRKKALTSRREHVLGCSLLAALGAAGKASALGTLDFGIQKDAKKDNTTQYNTLVAVLDGQAALINVRRIKGAEGGYRIRLRCAVAVFASWSADSATL